jgi:hypothetical protein
MQPQLVVTEPAPAESSTDNLWNKPYKDLTKEELRILKQQFFRS